MGLLLIIASNLEKFNGFSKISERSFEEVNSFLNSTWESKKEKLPLKWILKEV